MFNHYIRFIYTKLTVGSHAKCAMISSTTVRRELSLAQIAVHTQFVLHSGVNIDTLIKSTSSGALRLYDLLY